jgi:transcriptional regulator with XRE-family HTH domain
MSQRDLSSPGISYAYISRIEGGARTPSVKALRRIAGKLGVTVEHLETGEPTSTELGVADAGVEYASLTTAELRVIRAAVEEGAREAARGAAEQVIEHRQEAEREELRKATRRARWMIRSQTTAVGYGRRTEHFAPAAHRTLHGTIVSTYEPSIRTGRGQPGLGYGKSLVRVRCCR